MSKESVAVKRSFAGTHLIHNLSKRPEVFSFLGFIVICILMTFVSDRFLTISNLTNIIRQVSINAIIAAGMTVVILSGGIDLSVGSVMALSGTFSAGLMIQGVPIIIAAVIGLLVGAAFGLVNGTLIAFAKLPPIIVTLAMMEIPRGIGLLYTGGYPLINLPNAFSFLGNGRILGIPMPIYVMLLVYLVAYFLLNRIPFGRYVYSLGGNEKAARLSGVPVQKNKVLIYVLSGATAALGGLVLTSRLASGQPQAGGGFELDAIAAVVLGGTDINGGRGHILGTLVGAMILGVLNNGLNLMGVSPYIQRVLKGVIIILAIYVSSSRNRKKS